ncbi:hypothetical protein KQ313_01140 [Synechococcus sp. CS-1325]|uniref:hypothetical protein n=1 Tax=Synechococcus sp. CS-1325 TaxID=2847979 RepID=UPI00223B70E9|nr:hypothetical protein [Synechococcus sp. CS-1325]MCT0198299.1 hypothetical protein [Synechococcus sp. CS-1325]
MERSIGLFERLGGLDQRDELLFKDIVRSSVLTASSGMLPAIPRDNELALSDAWLEVFEEVLPRNKYRSAGTPWPRPIARTSAKTPRAVSSSSMVHPVRSRATAVPGCSRR